MRVELLLTKSGEKPYSLPISADRTRTPVLPGNIGRRELQIRFLFKDPKVGRESAVYDFYVDGSNTNPSSLWLMAPRGSARLRFDVSLRSVSWAGGKAVDVQAILTERQLSDDRYVVNEFSQELASQAISLEP
jgi:hypothetical protein